MSGSNLKCGFVGHVGTMHSEVKVWEQSINFVWDSPQVFPCSAFCAKFEKPMTVATIKTATIAKNLLSSFMKHPLPENCLFGWAVTCLQLFWQLVGHILMGRAVLF